jgi:hypothetical protein
MPEAVALIETAADRLWTPDGRDGLTHLKGRGLTESSIRTARLGWTPTVRVPSRDGARYFQVTGITIPWFERGRLTLVKIRQPAGKRPKYVEAYRDRPGLFSGPQAIKPGKPLIITEGELDCLLVAQELGDLAAVVTLGSASARPDGAILGMMLAAPAWYVATDADDAGDKAASEWPARAMRVRPPSPGKDWTEVHRAGFNRIRYLWGGILRGPSKSQGGPEVTLADDQPESN